jgi:hypothetical protein
MDNNQFGLDVQQFEILPGRRVAKKSDGRRGWCRYVGPKKSSTAQSEWYAGVVWDRPEWKEEHTALNDGSIEPFCSCAEESARASLLPQTQLTAGQSLLRAWYDKYAQSLPNNLATSLDNGVYSFPVGYIGPKSVNLVTRSAAQTITTTTTATTTTKKTNGITFLTLPSLACVVLREQRVARHLASSQDDNVLQTLSAHVTEFDLSANLVSTWEDIVSCVQYMTRLHTLNLSENRWTMGIESLATCDTFCSLRVLVLNDCELTWNHHILRLCQLCPALEELHVAKNQLTSLHPLSSLTALTALRTLNLSANSFRHWSDLQPLACLPSLGRLLVNENALSTVPPPSEAEGTAYEWRTLTSLSLSHNQLSMWEAIDALSCRLPALRELRLQHNPLVASATAHSSLRGCLSVRQALIARLSTLHTLNGSVISDKERSEAEKAYLRYCVLAADSERKDVVQYAHFTRLAALHGMPLAGVGTSAPITQSALTSDVVSLTLRYLNESVVKNLPLTLTVANVKTLFRRLFKLNAPSLHLVAVLEPHTLPLPLDDDLSSLQDYGIRATAEIIAHDA